MLCVACFLQSGSLNANTRHDPRSEYNQQKNERSECQWSWGVWKCSENPAGVLGSRVPWENFLGCKEHLDLLKIDLNAAEVITLQDHKHTKK